MNLHDHFTISTVEHHGVRTTDGWERNAYTITLTAPHGTITTPYGQGMGITTPPKLEDVLYALWSDTAGVEACPKFEDWAKEYGLDPDSRKAYKLFTETKKRADVFRKAVGDLMPALGEFFENY